MDDVPHVGDKNASLGEMMSGLAGAELRVPDGFATTANAYWAFLAGDDLRTHIEGLLFEYQTGVAGLRETGRAIRRLFTNVTLPVYLAESIRQAYRELSARYGTEEVDVAVRSSAAAEDLAGGGFAGQHETFLNVVGEEELLEACRKCYASLFTDRAIAYREEHGIDHMQVALSIGVQKMVRADVACSGVMYTADIESGFPGIVLVNAAWGLGPNVVQGAITPDQYEVFKPLLDVDGARPIIGKRRGTKDKKLVYGNGDSRSVTNVRTPIVDQHRSVLRDDEILQLARWAVAIEDHYGRPMDIEWAKDGETDALFLLQARPETVHSLRERATLKTFKLKEEGRRLVAGQSIGSAVAHGRVCLVLDALDLEYVEPGCIVVAAMTEPDWMPALRRAAGIVTDYGGRTCHAAIVSRELGIPAIVGTGEATQLLRDGQQVTLSCAQGEEGALYEGLLDYDVTTLHVDEAPATHTRVKINLASPEAAFKWWHLPVDGIGLARMEFIISQHVKIHPMALVHFDTLRDGRAKRRIRRMTRGYEDKTEFFVDHLARGLAKVAASQYPDPVVVRMSDFKTNEYARLIGGEAFEPAEDNPMLGWRGAARYYSDRYREGFALECRAVKKAREVLGLANIVVMIPFCRTPEEADRVLEEMARCGLRRGDARPGQAPLQIHMTCEVPSNVVLLEAFAERFDGFSIGSNDLAQLVLGVDRGSAELAHLFDESHEAVRRVIRDAIERAHDAGRPIGFCGQAPSDDPEYAAFLVDAGIDAISVNPDSVLGVRQRIARIEQETGTLAMLVPEATGEVPLAS